MGSHKLVELVFYVSLIVIILLAVTFTVLYILYTIYKRKHIRYGHEDDKILLDLKKKYKKEYETRYHILTKDLNVETDIPNYRLEECLKNTKRKSKSSWLANKIFSIILFVVIIVLGGFIISYKVNHDAFFFGDTTYLVIQTNSMETINNNNTYLKENNLNNQIIQYSMIGIEKVETKNIKQYDILAFKNSDGDIIVHRVINITKNEGNQLVFTLRGDANLGSNTYEVAVKEEAIIGKYNGYQNYVLGVATTYFKSSAGIVALASGAIFLLSFEISEDQIDKEYEKRKLIVAQNYDKNGK